MTDLPVSPAIKTAAERVRIDAEVMESKRCVTCRELFTDSDPRLPVGFIQEAIDGRQRFELLAHDRPECLPERILPASLMVLRGPGDKRSASVIGEPAARAAAAAEHVSAARLGVLDMPPGSNDGEAAYLLHLRLPFDVGQDDLDGILTDAYQRIAATMPAGTECAVLPQTSEAAEAMLALVLRWCE